MRCNGFKRENFWVTQRCKSSWLQFSRNEVLGPVPCTVHDIGKRSRMGQSLIAPVNVEESVFGTWISLTAWIFMNVKVIAYPLNAYIQLFLVA